MARYHYVQWGNCIDIYDAATGKTVAYLNCMDQTAQETFDRWMATQRLPVTRKFELALLVVALLAGIGALPFLAAAFGSN